MTVCEKLKLLDQTLWPLMPRGAKYERFVNSKGIVVVRMNIHATLPDGNEQLKCLVHQRKLLDALKTQKAVAAYGNKIAKDFAKELKAK